MKNNLKRVLVIACILVFGVGSASANTVKPTYVAISSLSCSLDISSGSAQCLGNVLPIDSTNTSTLSVSLKHSINGTTWTTVKSWSRTASGFFGVTIEESTAVSSGYKYRLTVNATIRDAGGTIIETASKNSWIIDY